MTLEQLVEKAKDGDGKALEEIIVQLRERVYNLAIRMLLFPEDAQDATQEILIKVITQLSTFKGKSKLTTWVYRIATNYLITTKGKLSSSFAMSIDAYGELIDRGRSEEVTYARNEGEIRLLEEEVKVSCTHGLLLCLNEQSRIVYILSQILDLNSIEGAEILNISTDNFRKQLSRARSKIRNFLNQKCGLYNPQNPCRCRKKIDSLIDQDLLNLKNLRFAGQTDRSIELIDQIKTLEKDIAIYRSTPNMELPEEATSRITKTLIHIKQI